jgi:hypothetical protein
VAIRLFQVLESHVAGAHESFTPGEIGFGARPPGLDGQAVARFVREN